MKRALRKCLLDGGGKDWDEILPYVAMGYRMSKHKSLGYSPYFLMFGRDPILQNRHQPLGEELLNVEATIAQQRDKERYSLVRGGGWDRPKATFKPRDYVLLKQQTKNCLLPPARPHILRVVELRSSGVVMLERRDAARCQRQVKDIAHSPLPILDASLQPERFYRAPTLCCRVCGSRSGGPTMGLCDRCNQGYHIWCCQRDRGCA